MRRLLQSPLRAVRRVGREGLPAGARLSHRRRPLREGRGLLRRGRHRPPRRRQRSMRDPGWLCGRYLQKPDRVQPRGGRVPLQELRVRDLVRAQRLLRRARQFGRLPARQARRPAVPRAWRLRERGRRVCVRQRLLRRRPLRARRERQARVPDRLQPLGRRVHGQRGLLRGPALHRGPGFDERRLRNPVAAAAARRRRAAARYVRSLRPGVRDGWRLLQRRSVHHPRWAGMRGGLGLLLREPTGSMRGAGQLLRLAQSKAILHDAGRLACARACAPVF